MSACGRLLAMSVLAIASCTRSDFTGPPELRLGRDECAECGMLINEDRCSSAMLVDDRGRRDYLLFDDIGCMLDFERGDSQDRVVIERFVHDHRSRRWLRAGEARFVLANPDKISTPMGTGILAFEHDAQALEASQRYQGTPMDYTNLARARKQWMESRHGVPDK